MDHTQSHPLPFIISTICTNLCFILTSRSPSLSSTPHYSPRSPIIRTMGIHISRTAALAPISAASTVIGFVSFGVTVGTFLRVFWGNIQTVMHARREIPVSAECVICG